MNATMNNLPELIKSDVYEHLKYFPIAHIRVIKGKYFISAGIGIADKYSDSDIYLGFVKNTEIYSANEIDYFISQM